MKRILIDFNSILDTSTKKTMSEVITSNIDALNNKQDKSDILTGLRNLSLSADKLILATGENSFSTTALTTTGKNIISATDAKAIRKALGIGHATFFDETEKVIWQKVGSPYISTDNAKFNRALQCSEGNIIQSKEAVTFGGQDFTIDIWTLINSSSANYTNLFQATLGGYSNLFHIWWYVNGNALNAEKYATGANAFDVQNEYWGAKIAANSVCHFEFCYRHSDAKLFVFQNGIRPTLVTTWDRQISIDRVARTLILGGATCSISEFRILDGVCLHTGDFSPPTTPYELTDETISLLHFD